MELDEGFVPVEVRDGKVGVRLGAEVSYRVPIHPYDSISITGKIVSLHPPRLMVTEGIVPMVRIRPGYTLPLHDGTILRVYREDVELTGNDGLIRSLARFLNR